MQMTCSHVSVCKKMKVITGLKFNNEGSHWDKILPDIEKILGG